MSSTADLEALAEAVGVLTDHTSPPPPEPLPWGAALLAVAVGYPILWGLLLLAGGPTWQ